MEYLEKAARSLEMAERYEQLGELYKLVIPIYEFNRDYEVCRITYCLVKHGIKYIEHLYFEIFFRKGNIMFLQCMKLLIQKTLMHILSYLG